MNPIRSGEQALFEAHMRRDATRVRLRAITVKLSANLAQFAESMSKLTQAMKVAGDFERNLATLRAAQRGGVTTVDELKRLKRIARAGSGSVCNP